MGNKGTFSPIIKERVKDALKSKGKTQKEMAADLDITPEHLTRCLTKGKISKTWLISIAQYLDVAISWLTGELDFELRYDAEQRAMLNGDELLRSYMLWLGWSHEEQQKLTDEDLYHIKNTIKMIIDSVFVQMHQRTPKTDE